jgi:hypothetical protein
MPIEPESTQAEHRIDARSYHLTNCGMEFEMYPANYRRLLSCDHINLVDLDRRPRPRFQTETRSTNHINLLSMRSHHCISIVMYSADDLAWKHPLLGDEHVHNTGQRGGLTSPVPAIDGPHHRVTDEKDPARTAVWLLATGVAAPD